MITAIDQAVTVSITVRRVSAGIEFAKVVQPIDITVKRSICGNERIETVG